MDLKVFGKKIREKRKAFNLSLQEFADICHINIGYLRQIEAGLKFPSTQLLLVLCNELKTSPNYLLEYADDTDDQEIYSRIYRLRPDQKKLMICLLDVYLNFDNG